MKLVIVESPAKAKTIEKYLGSDYTVRASVGHVRDLPKSNKKAIDIEAGFVPHYEVSKGKEKVLKDLGALAKKSDEILLATDPDREGEAIAWHIVEALDLDSKKTKRVVFHEITEAAVQDAIKAPRDIDSHLREAQEARRVLDRLVGYDLSGLIWKKVRYGLSAGRVQSPALRILMEREREIRAFDPEDFWVIKATLGLGKDEIEFTCTEEPKTEEETNHIVESGKKNSWHVVGVEEREQARKSRAPFTTSTLQQTASSRYGFSPSNTMRIAQKLYEAGHITYMRTDSTSLAKDAVAAIAGVVAKEFGKENHQVKTYKTKSKSAQEAHEAIRPTNPSKKSAGTTEEQKKLYRLIWARSVSSQMIDATLLRTKITANITPGSNIEAIPNFTVTGSRVINPGWLLADPDARGEDVELPKAAEGEDLKLINIESEAKQTQPPSRYTEAGLVKELEKRGIGRPSTYAAIIKNIQSRGYVDKDGRTLIPTDTGDVVSSFLEQHFAEYIGDDFTAEMEDELDEIADGKREYVKTLADFYSPFQTQVAKKDKEIGKITTLGDADPKWECPKCGKKMVIKLGKSGKFMSCENFPDCMGARTIEGEEMKEPEETGEECPKCGAKAQEDAAKKEETDEEKPKKKSRKKKQEPGKLVERHGRYGPFIACSNYPKCKFIKEDEETKKARSTGVNCPICKDGEMTEKRGRFGIFYACSNYPDCKHAIKAKPTGAICGYNREDGPCTHLMMEGTKTIPERCSDKACPNHNPHKLDK